MTTTLLRNGTLYDGTGSPPITADLLIHGDRIARVGDLPLTQPCARNPVSTNGSPAPNNWGIRRRNVV